MAIKKRIIIIASALVAAAAVICVIIFGNANQAVSDTIAPETKKIQLQEQLADELQKYYLGDERNRAIRISPLRRINRYRYG